MSPAGSAASPIRTVAGVVYGEVPGYRPLELDLYLPADAAGPVPLIVYLHGGGWRRGSRHTTLPALGPDFYPRLANATGCAVAAADYRLSGEAVFPAQLDDVNTALAWAASSAAELGVDGSRPVLWGESAGAHLGLLAGLAPGSCARGVVAWFPPTDLLGLAADLVAAGLPAEVGPRSREALLLGAAVSTVAKLAAAASPVGSAHAGAPPVLLMHGTADDLVPAAQSERLAAALREVGAPVELDLVEGAGHMWRGAVDVSAIVERSVRFVRTVCH